jgi:UDP-glucose 4-epimerase
MNDISMTIFGDGEQKRAFSFIDDCLEPLWKSAVKKEASKEIINLGSSKFYTINEANRILKSLIGGGSTKYEKKRHEVKNAHPTWEKSMRILDYRDKISLKDGLNLMWEWAKSQPDRERFVWNKYEIERGIYDFWKIKK